MKTVWVLTLFLHCALSEKFEVLGPGSPVVAVAGSDVVLPCSVRRLAGQSSLSAVDMNIQWTRPDLGDGVVHFYENHRDVNTRQIPQYSGRTAVFTEELQNGNVSLRLRKVDLHDEGNYKCRVDSEYWNDDVSIYLRVEVIGEHPVISVEKYDSNSEQFSLLCESKGWRPEPDLQWLNSKGENQTAGDTDSHRNCALFNVKRRFTVHKNHIDTFYCRATLGENQKIKYTKEEQIKSEVLYDLLPMPTGAKVGIVLAVILVLILAGILAGIVLYKYKERKRKEEEERWEREWKEKEELKKVILALENPEEEQRNDSSVTTALLKDLRKVPLQELREKLRRLLNLALEFFCLPLPGRLPTPDTYCYITGWGHMGNRMPFKLQEGEVRIISLSQCQSYFDMKTITSRMLCAGYEAGTIDSCMGDSGGPLVCEDSDGRWSLYGLTSWGSVCFSKVLGPGVYANVTHFTEWIQRQIYLHTFHLD
ncbi:hypothetical protein SRHO_G00140600 [Serrasalmus rhombeus]